MTIQQIIRNKDILTHVAPLDLELLLSFVLKKPREYLFAHSEKKLSRRQIEKFNSLLRRRRRGVPVAYLIGQKEFFGLDFLVDKNVLVPRPETELLVEEAIKKIFFLDPRFRGDDNLTLIDIGTGSGNIIVSVAKALPAAIGKKLNFFATDISEKALAVARKNAKRHRVDQLIKFIKSDLLEYLINQPGIKAKNLLVMANLPYVAPKIYQISRENLKFEPKNALVSQHNGLGHYFKLFRQIQEIRNRRPASRITCYVEISPEQKSALQKRVRDIFPTAKISFQKDLAGKWRMAEIDLQ